MQDADLVFYVELELKPEYVEEWKEAVVAVIEQMSREPAFISCSLQQHIDDPVCFTLYERWREPSVEAFIRNQFDGKDYRQEYEARLPEMLRTPRSPTVLRHIQEWRAS